MSASAETPTALTPVAPRAIAPLPKRDFSVNLPPFPAHPLLDAPAPRTRMPLLFGLAVFLVFVVGFAIWAGWAPLAEASVASGVIKVEGSRRTIQHLEGGIVREILFHDGAKVKAGGGIPPPHGGEAGSQPQTPPAPRRGLLAPGGPPPARNTRAPRDGLPPPPPR